MYFDAQHELMSLKSTLYDLDMKIGKFESKINVVLSFTVATVGVAGAGGHFRGKQPSLKGVLVLFLYYCIENLSISEMVFRFHGQSKWS